MTLRIEYLPDSLQGKIISSTDFPAFVWNRLKELVLAAEPDADITGRVALIDWVTVLAIAPGIATLRGQHNFSVEYEPAAKDHLLRYREQYLAIRAASERPGAVIPEEDIQERLDALGFSKRRLKDEQIRDTAQMLSLRNGANFSVPGAGKTTVAFAVHLLSRDPDSHLLVVSPKNAFSAWDEVIAEGFDPANPSSDLTPFVRLEGGYQHVRRLLRTPPGRMVISYDQLIRTTALISTLMGSNKIHVVLDESHRMKAGNKNQRGTALLSLSHLPIRRDILSGTPIPRTLEDISPQLDFIWPGQGLGARVLEAASPATVLRGLYVRTTKHELRLPPILREFVPVEMSPSQLALYSLLRQEVLKRMAKIRADANIDLMSARKSVIRLLQVSSNPILLVRSLAGEEPSDFDYNDPKIEAIFSAILADRDSPKIQRTCELARTLAGKGARSVIWSSFTDNVVRIAELLSDLGATYIHGQVPTGDERDPGTREGRIRLFHDDSSGCRVLVANPAACGEGISLHRACHHAIYVDRTYNAGHYLQSVDRIHRLGLLPDEITYVHVLESVAPNVTGAIDFSVRRRMIQKLRLMATVLEDVDLRQLALDEEEGEEPIDYDITIDDLADLIDELSGSAAPAGEEE